MLSFQSPRKEMTKPMSSHILLMLLLILYFNLSLAVPVTYNILNLGAKPDGKSDSTEAFLAAWTKACGSSEAATVYVPLGRFLLKSIVFSGQCKNDNIVVRIDGTLMAPTDYSVTGNDGTWILFEHVNGVSINGGTLDGQGTGLWACKKGGNKGCYDGATVS